MSKEQHPEIFADELVGLLLSYPISKLTFVTARQAGDDGAIEKEKVLTLTLSTQSLLNACNLVLNNAKKNQELLLKGISSGEEKLLASLQGGIAPVMAEATAAKPAAKKKARVTK